MPYQPTPILRRNAIKELAESFKGKTIDEATLGQLATQIYSIYRKFFDKSRFFDQFFRVRIEVNSESGDIEFAPGNALSADMMRMLERFHEGQDVDYVELSRKCDRKYCQWADFMQALSVRKLLDSKRIEQPVTIHTKEERLALEREQKKPRDVCICGDFREDHPDDGPCKFNESGHGGPGLCDGFRGKWETAGTGNLEILTEGEGNEKSNAKADQRNP